MIFKIYFLRRKDFIYDKIERWLFLKGHSNKKICVICKICGKTDNAPLAEKS